MAAQVDARQSVINVCRLERKVDFFFILPRWAEAVLSLHLLRLPLRLTQRCWREFKKKNKAQGSADTLRLCPGGLDLVYGQEQKGLVTAPRARGGGSQPGTSRLICLEDSVE